MPFSAVPAPAGAAVFFIPLRAVPMEPSGSPAPAFLTHVFSRAIMKPKEEILHVESYVSHLDWHRISNLCFGYTQNDWNHAELMFGFAQPFPPLRERLFLISGSLVKAALFYVPGPGREALAALPALLFRFIGGKGPDQVLFALAPPVIIPRQDPVGRVQVIRQAQLRVLCLPQPFFTSSMVVRR